MMLRTCAVAVILCLGADDEPTNPLLASLPRTEGVVELAGLDQPVRISLDALSVPVVRGEALDDVLRGQGYMHGQNRYFQMDLTRRLASGRLAALVGAPAVSTDQYFRRYRFQAVAERLVAHMPQEDRRKLEVYAEGVNAGLADLGAPPPEYGFLQAKPEPWRAEDSVLVLLSMFTTLNFNASYERSLGVMKETLPEELYSFLTPVETRFDAPLLPADQQYAFEPMPVPGPEIVDLRTQDAGAFLDDLVLDPPLALGSNNWAVAGSRSAHGGAMLANDPHLPLTAPGVWYRCGLSWGEVSASGLGLPGVPGIAIGSNGHIAWGFTNTMGDFQDLIVVEVDPEDPNRYRTPDGFEAFEEITESIQVKGAEPETLQLRKTRWGVVTDEDWQGRPLVLKWTALEPGMVNFRLLEMMMAEKLEEGVELARTWYGPSQNVLFADKGGRIAWVVSGYLPQRAGFDGSVPVSWAEAGVGWTGPKDETLRPSTVDPPAGILYTANNRTVDVPWSRQLGNTWDLGARAGRIRDLLNGSEKLTEQDLQDIQLDTRVEFLDFYRDLALEVTADAAPDSITAQAREILQQWSGRADIDQPGMRILNAYARRLKNRVLSPLLAPCHDADGRFRYSWFQSEEPARRILEERPAHLLPPGYSDWHELLAGTLSRVLEDLAAAAPEQGIASLWGTESRARVHHLLADAVPMFARMLNMPDDPIPGYAYSVRVAMGDFGASVRMVVSPGREGQGLLHMPAGQSGHPMSPHYRDGHEAWLKGLHTPFKAGEATAEFVLVPPGFEP